jgi:1-acyl-sn-glycerol-3-phosphate acyltransferase
VVADRMVPRLPWISTLFARVGVVSGTRANVRRLLDSEELLAIFPEGVAGLAKPASERYRLQRWQVGHAELAIRHRAPVIPVAILGAQESWPLLLRLHTPLFGAPYLPVPRYPVPLPVPYRIIYGAPLHLHTTVRPWQVDDPDVIAAAAARTHDAVARLVADGLAARRAP